MFFGVFLADGWCVAVRVAGRLALPVAGPPMPHASHDGSFFCFRRGMSAIGVKRAGLVPFVPGTFDSALILCHHNFAVQPHIS